MTTSTTYSNLLRVLAVAILAMASVTARAAEDADSTRSWLQRGFIGKVVRYFSESNKTEITRRPSFSFIGGPHYSSDTGFGIGLVAAGLYSTQPEDTTLLPSNVSLFADLTTGGYFKIGVEGLHLYHRGDRRVDYELSFNSYTTYFWGVGYDAARIESNKTRYLLLDIMLSGDHLWRLGSTPMYAGPLMRFNYIAARHIDDDRDALWGEMPRAFVALGTGVKLQFDTRDNYTAPRTGWMGELIQRVYPRFLGNSSHSFASTEFSLNKYTPLWRGSVLAARIHGMFTYGRTPWGMMPTVGGNSMLRGYYEGQYRDKCESDVTLELRQHVWGRSGVAVWGGLGAVYPNFSKFHKRDLLPNFGVGYRWEFKKLTNVRVDVGFGKGCWGVVLNINEAF